MVYETCFYYALSDEIKDFMEMIGFLASNQIYFRVSRMATHYRILVNKELIGSRDIAEYMNSLYQKHKKESIKRIVKREMLE